MVPTRSTLIITDESALEWVFSRVHCGWADGEAGEEDFSSKSRKLMHLLRAGGSEAGEMHFWHLKSFHYEKLQKRICQRESLLMKILNNKPNERRIQASSKSFLLRSAIHSTKLYLMKRFCRRSCCFLRSSTFAKACSSIKKSLFVRIDRLHPPHSQARGLYLNNLIHNQSIAQREKEEKTYHWHVKFCCIKISMREYLHDEGEEEIVGSS